jgi:tetratricopeptide (TPR) repeat protein
MRRVAGRSVLAAIALSLLLAGCQTDGSFDIFGTNEQRPPQKAAAYDHPPNPNAKQNTAPDVTGSVFQQPLPPPPPAPEPTPVYNNPLNNTPQGEVLPGNNAEDDLKLGKKHYRENNYGLAERHFRRSVEANPRNAEAWMGLAASYDKLRRFELADRAYEQAFAILGPVPELLNNHGYSYILRGDYKKARVKLMAAKAKDPSNPYIQNNIDLLEDSIRNAR